MGTDSQRTPVLPPPGRGRAVPGSLLSVGIGGEVSERDIRRKRPLALSFLLRGETFGRMARVLSLLALDFAGVGLAVFTALAFKALVHDDVNVHDLLDGTREILAFAYLVTVLLFARSGLYANRAQRPGLTRIVASLFQVTFVALIFALISGKHFSSYYIFYGSLAFAILYVSLFRYIYDRLTDAIMRVAGHRRRAVLVGDSEHVRDVAQALSDSPHPRTELVGFLALGEPNGSGPVAVLAPSENGPALLGSIRDLSQVLTSQRIDELIITDPSFPQEDAVELVDRCHRNGVRVRIAPSTMELLVHRAEFVPGESVPLFELMPPVFEGIDYALKRLFDVVVSGLVLVVLSPLLLAITLAVRLSSRGPILFRSMRPGIGQMPFACLKFRTMRWDAARDQASLETLNEASGALFKIRNDPRLTPVGRLLRRFSLDELPQLVNVLRGEMSLVGPRPLPQRDYERLEEWHRKRYLVLPGMTGLWQVSGRSELDFDDLVQLDFIYLERWSLALDFTILLKTVPAVLSRRGAY